MKVLAGRFAIVFAVVAVWLAAPSSAFAQVPDHVPGTVCYTPQFWCWAQPPGPPGYPCGCPTAYGNVPGVLG